MEIDATVVIQKLTAQIADQAYRIAMLEAHIESMAQMETEVDDGERNETA